MNEASRPLRAVRKQGQALLALLQRHAALLWAWRTWHGFWEHRNLVNASALTYSTMLAVVPLVAVVLALLQAAGFSESLRPFLLDQFPVLDATVVDALLDYIGRANAQAVGGVGLVALLITCGAMLGSVESSLNHILGVRQQRSYGRRMSDYFAMLLVGAVMVVASIAGRTLVESPLLLESILGVQDAVPLLLRFSPWLTAWAAFFFLYTWMPNRSVSWRSALVGALVGGSLFQLVQVGYVELQLGFARYHAVYGALAQLPILLIWVYLSWVVVMIGAEGIAALSALREPPRVSGSDEWAPAWLALAALHEVTRAFEQAEPTPRAEALAVRLGVSVQSLRQALDPLLTAGVLVEPDDEHGYLPAAAAAAVPLESVLAPLRRQAITG